MWILFRMQEIVPVLSMFSLFSSVYPFNKSWQKVATCLWLIFSALPILHDVLSYHLAGFQISPVFFYVSMRISTWFPRCFHFFQVFLPDFPKFHNSSQDFIHFSSVFLWKCPFQSRVFSGDDAQTPGPREFAAPSRSLPRRPAFLG